MLLKLRRKTPRRRYHAARKVGLISRISLILKYVLSLSTQGDSAPRVASDVLLCSSDYCPVKLTGERGRAEKSPDC